VAIFLALLGSWSNRFNDVLAETSNWDIATALGTIGAAFATVAAVLAALYISRREHAATQESLAVSQRLLEHAEEDRQEARRAQVDVDWWIVREPARRSDGRSASRVYYFLRVRNLGPGVAREILVEPLDPEGGERPQSSSVVVPVLFPGQSVTPVAPRPVHPSEDSAQVVWIDGDGRHVDVLPLYLAPEN
jgi:hypothetical protein